MASEVNPLTRLKLEQLRIDLQRKVDSTDDSNDLSQLETEFTKVAKSYADRKKISYQAFRKVGVPASVLQRAGIPRNS